MILSLVAAILNFIFAKLIFSMARGSILDPPECILGAPPTILDDFGKLSGYFLMLFAAIFEIVSPTRISIICFLITFVSCTLALPPLKNSSRAWLHSAMLHAFKL